VVAAANNGYDVAVDCQLFLFSLAARDTEPTDLCRREFILIAAWKVGIRVVPCFGSVRIIGTQKNLFAYVTGNQVRKPVGKRAFILLVFFYRCVDFLQVCCTGLNLLGNFQILFRDSKTGGCGGTSVLVGGSCFLQDIVLSVNRYNRTATILKIITLSRMFVSFFEMKFSIVTFPLYLLSYVAESRSRYNIKVTVDGYFNRIGQHTQHQIPIH
jgi:hypothetical protein